MGRILWQGDLMMQERALLKRKRVQDLGHRARVNVGKGARPRLPWEQKLRQSVWVWMSEGSSTSAEKMRWLSPDCIRSAWEVWERKRSYSQERRGKVNLLEERNRITWQFDMSFWGLWSAIWQHGCVIFLQNCSITWIWVQHVRDTDIKHYTGVTVSCGTYTGYRDVRPVKCQGGDSKQWR